eukprot:4673160-Amphidinium_carterae.2
MRNQMYCVACRPHDFGGMMLSIFMSLFYRPIQLLQGWQIHHHPDFKQNFKRWENCFLNLRGYYPSFVCLTLVST